MGMNPSKPHELRQFESVEELEDAGFVKVPSEDAAAVHDMNAHERSRYLRKLQSGIQAGRVTAVAQKVYEGLHRAARQEEGSEDPNASLGVLLAVRLWQREFGPEADHIREGLSDLGVGHSDYIDATTPGETSMIDRVKRMLGIA